MKLHLTFSDDADDADRKGAIGCARDHGARAVEPMFPNPALPDLARYYVVDVDGKDADRLVEALRSSRGVRTIEPGPKRRALDRS